MKDYYSILGVDNNASQKDIQKAFLKLAQKYHPDKSGGDSAKFKEVNEAYQVLNNPEKRSQYDRGGYAGPGTQGGSQGFRGFDFSNMDFGSSMGASGLEDLLRNVFQGAMNKGSDIKINIQITFEESIFGATKTISIPYRRKHTEKINITIPAGIENQSHIKIEGRGEPAKDKKYEDGDLYVLISVKEHKDFKRHGGELILPISLLPTEALLGTKKELNDLKGEPLLLNIPELTKEGDTLSLDGKGIPRPVGSGRLIVLCHIRSPKKLSSKAKDLLEQLKNEGL